MQLFPVPMSENGDNKVPWFSWTGERSQREIVHVHPKQNEYNLFQNTSCAPITESKIGGNTNVREVIPGPLGSYTGKCPVKEMQQQDSEPYENVIEGITKALDGPVIHDNKRSKVLRIVMRAGCVHNKTMSLVHPWLHFSLDVIQGFFFRINLHSFHLMTC